MAEKNTIARRDQNRITTIMGVSSVTATVDNVDYVEGITPVNIAVNPTTGAIIVEEA